MAVPTNGRVVISTTVGDIDIELWAKETPKTCRNFLALAMEGYYDGVIFHRVIPGFLVQTGDRSGTGAGGESFYGEPFEDEIHPRLKFPHRGIVAMANSGVKNSNDSQFFITLDRADELYGKHTVFGRCVGDSVYNVMKIGELELDANEKPVYPPKIKSIRIVDNPFGDIIPRITAAEKRAQARAREQAQKEREAEMKKKGRKKNTTLLSFAAEEEDSGEMKKMPIARPDLVEIVPAVPDFVTNVSRKSKEPKELSEKPIKAKDKEVDITKIREKHAKEKEDGENSRKAEIAKMEADIRKLAKRGNDSDDEDEEQRRKKAKKSYLQEELSKYSKGRGVNKKGKKKDERDVLAALDAFRGKLKGTFMEEDEPMLEGETQEQPLPDPEDPGIEVDDDRGFLGHLLHFSKDNNEEMEKAERDYEVIDPRQRGARAKEEERARKDREKRSRHGSGRHRR